MISFVGAGPGAVDLITIRGQQRLHQADVVIYAGSLINPDLLKLCKSEALLYNSALMTLEEVICLMEQAELQRKRIVRLHSGDPSLYGAVREQMDLLDERGISYEMVPGVSAFSAAAASLHVEYTLPGVSQSLIITRIAGRTPVPEHESVEEMAAHQTSMAYYLSTGMLKELTERLTLGGYAPDTPAAVVYKASWPDEKIICGTLSSIASRTEAEHIHQTALILIGSFLTEKAERSRLYDPDFSHGFRKASEIS